VWLTEHGHSCLNLVVWEYVIPCAIKVCASMCYEGTWIHVCLSSCAGRKRDECRWWDPLNMQRTYHKCDAHVIPVNHQLLGRAHCTNNITQLWHGGIKSLVSGYLGLPCVRPPQGRGITSNLCSSKKKCCLVFDSLASSLLSFWLSSLLSRILLNNFNKVSRHKVPGRAAANSLEHVAAERFWPRQLDSDHWPGVPQ